MFSIQHFPVDDQNKFSTTSQDEHAESAVMWDFELQ